MVNLLYNELVFKEGHMNSALMSGVHQKNSSLKHEILLKLCSQSILSGFI